MTLTDDDLAWFERFALAVTYGVLPPADVERAKAILRAIVAETGRLPVEPSRRPRYAPKEHP